MNSATVPLTRYRPTGGATGQQITPWMNGGWHCPECRLSAPRNVMDWILWATKTREVQDDERELHKQSIFSLEALQAPLREASRTGFLPTWTNFRVLADIAENRDIDDEDIDDEEEEPVE